MLFKHGLNTEINCPACGARDSLVLGSLAPVSIFAGRALNEYLEGGRLYKCGKCQLGFRFPRLDKLRLDDLYRGGPSESWEYAANSRRIDWEIAREHIMSNLSRTGRAASVTVLDVGCFDGAFLLSLPDSIEKYGIEMGASAAMKARKCGVDILSDDYESLAKAGRRFDFVTAFDLIEHVPDPALFLGKLVDATRIGGRIFIASGDFLRPERKLMGSKYWYTHPAEHISFVSPAWFKSQSEAHGFVVNFTTRYRHDGANPRLWLTQLAKNIAFKTSPGSTIRARRSVSGLPFLGPPAWTAARDHFIVELRPV